jgi:hypothetical protein
MRLISFEWIMNARRRSLGAPQNVVVGKNHVLWWDSDGRLWGWKNSDTNGWDVWSYLSTNQHFLTEFVPWNHLVQLRISWKDPQKNCDAIAVDPQHGIFPLTFPWMDDEQDAQRAAEVFLHNPINLFLLSAQSVIPLRGAAAALCCSWKSLCFGIDATGHLNALPCGASGEVAEPLPVAVPRGRQAVGFIYTNEKKYSRHVLFEDGSLGRLPPDRERLRIQHVQVGDGLDGPIAELINYIRDKTRFSILVRTQTGRWYVTFYDTRSRGHVIWHDAMSGKSDASLITFENLCGDAVRMLISPTTVVMQPDVVDVPTNNPLIDVIISHPISGGYYSRYSNLSTATAAVVDVLGFIYLFEIQLDRGKRIGEIKVRHMDPSPINPEQPVLLV